MARTPPVRIPLGFLAPIPVAGCSARQTLHLAVSLVRCRTRRNLQDRSSAHQRRARSLARVNHSSSNRAPISSGRRSHSSSKARCLAAWGSRLLQLLGRCSVVAISVRRTSVVHPCLAPQRICMEREPLRYQHHNRTLKHSSSHSFNGWKSLHKLMIRALLNVDSRCVLSLSNWRGVLRVYTALLLQFRRSNAGSLLWASEQRC